MYIATIWDYFIFVFIILIVMSIRFLLNTDVLLASSWSATSKLLHGVPKTSLNIKNNNK